MFKTFINKNQDYQILLNDLMEKNAKIHQNKNKKIKMIRHKHKKQQEAIKLNFSRPKKSNSNPKLRKIKQKSPKPKNYPAMLSESMVEKSNGVFWNQSQIDDQESIDFMYNSEKTATNNFCMHFEYESKNRKSRKFDFKANYSGDLEKAGRMSEIAFQKESFLIEKMSFLPEFDEEISEIAIRSRS